MMDISTMLINDCLKEGYYKYEGRPAEEFRAYMDGLTDMLNLIAVHDFGASKKKDDTFMEIGIPEGSNPLDDPDKEELFLDAFSNRYFTSTKNRIKNARNSCMHEMLCGNSLWITLNEFYDAIGLPKVKAGERMGFCFDNPIDVRFIPSMSLYGHDTHLNEPVWVMSFVDSPRLENGVKVMSLLGEVLEDEKDGKNGESD